MMKFKNSIELFINNLTYENFKKTYQNITKIYTGNSFNPPDTILEKYFEFLKKLKPNFNNNYLSVVVAPRECFKTTTFSFVLPYMLLLNSIKNKDDLTTIVVGSFSQERVITAIYKPLQLILKERFEIITSTERHTIFKYKDKEFAIYPIHINSSLRSCNWKSKRPQLIILDDIDQPAYIQGIKTRELSVARFNGDFLPSIENGNSFILVTGNKESNISIINDLLEKSYVNKLVLPYKVQGKYLRPEWNEEWENKMREQLKDDFDRLYAHTLKTESFSFYKEKNPIGIKQVFLDFGVNDNSMVAVFFIGNTIVDIIKTNFIGLTTEIIPSIIDFKPDYVFFESNAIQGEVFRQILRPALIYYKLIPFQTTSNKNDRISLAINHLLNKNIKVIPELEKQINEEITIFEEEGNSHVLDMVGVFCIFNRAQNIKGKITYASKNN